MAQLTLKAFVGSVLLFHHLHHGQKIRHVYIERTDAFRVVVIYYALYRWQ
jgi:hypothetical protein